MTTESWIILLHQLLFQSMFFAKNVLLRRRPTSRSGAPIRKPIYPLHSS